jgi:hypothetical protein
MLTDPPTSNTTLAVVIGMMEAPGIGLEPMESLRHSAVAVVRFFRDPAGMGLAEGNVSNFFMEHVGRDDLLNKMGEFLGQRAKAMRDNHQPVRDVLIYYVGHGEFIQAGGMSEVYHLILHTTNEKGGRAATSLSLISLIEVLFRNVPGVRYSLIVDACYSGLAAGVLPRGESARADPLRLSATDIMGGVSKEKPNHPALESLALLCSSGRGQKSLAPPGEPYTMFTGALLEALMWGTPAAGKRLSLRETCAIATNLIATRFGTEGVLPEVHPAPVASADPAGVGLFPNHGNTHQWCAVQRESAGPDRFKGATSIFANSRRSRIQTTPGLGYSLAESPRYIIATEAVASPAAFYHAVRIVCRSEIAYFDVTDYQPAVMLLLGLRSVVRRAVTICCVDEDAATQNVFEAPFNLRDINPIGHSAAGSSQKLATSELADKLTEHTIAALSLLKKAPHTYLDLPTFDVIRQLPIDPRERVPREYYEKALVLCPFADDYGATNWPYLRNGLKESLLRLMNEQHQENKLSDEVMRSEPSIQRTRDMSAPSLVSQTLLQAIRWTDLCVIDWTGWRANVFFEFGIRLAANKLEPVCLIDEAKTAEMSRHAAELAGAKEPWLPQKSVQCENLRRLFDPVGYAAVEDEIGEVGSPFDQVVDRHFRDRSGSFPMGPAGRLSVDGPVMPPALTFNAVWTNYDIRSEQVSAEVAPSLKEEADLLRVDESKGQSPFLFGKNPNLVLLAEERCRDRLLAAWLLLHFGVGRQGLLSSRVHAKLYTDIGYALLGMSLTLQADASAARPEEAPNRDFSKVVRWIQKRVDAFEELIYEEDFDE